MKIFNMSFKELMDEFDNNGLDFIEKHYCYVDSYICKYTIAAGALEREFEILAGRYKSNPISDNDKITGYRRIQSAILARIEIINTKPRTPKYDPAEFNYGEMEKALAGIVASDLPFPEPRNRIVPKDFIDAMNYATQPMALDTEGKIPLSFSEKDIDESFKYFDIKIAASAGIPKKFLFGESAEKAIAESCIKAANDDFLRQLIGMASTPEKVRQLIGMPATQEGVRQVPDDAYPVSKLQDVKEYKHPRRCDCGAKHTFAPNHHAHWCSAKEW